MASIAVYELGVIAAAGLVVGCIAVYNVQEWVAIVPIAVLIVLHEVVIAKKNQVVTNIVKSIGKCLLGMVAGALMVTAALVVFGASPTEGLGKTWELAVTISYLGLMPKIVTGTSPSGISSFISLLKAGAQTSRINAATSCGAIGTVLCSWMSAAVLPLDWDAWWQKWPLPCIFGAVVGYEIGLVYGFFFHQGNSKKSPEQMM